MEKLLACVRRHTCILQGFNDVDNKIGTLCSLVEFISFEGEHHKNLQMFSFQKCKSKK